MPPVGRDSRPLKVLVLSATFGGGHWSAARALREYLRHRYPQEVEVEIVDFFEELVPGLSVLAKFAYQQPEPFFPAGYGTFHELAERAPSNPVVNELAATGVERAAEFMVDREPDCVISMDPVAGGVAAELTSVQPYFSATVMSDFSARSAWLHPATDLHFVACEEVRDDLVVRGIPYERVVVSGVPIGGSFAEGPPPVETARRELGLANRFTVMVAPAGPAAGDAATLVEHIAEAGVQVAAVAGRNERLKRRLESVARRNRLVKVYGFLDGMHSMMGAADVLVVNAGGLMVSESLAMRLPMLFSGPVPGQETDNVDFLVNWGAGLVCRDEEDAVEKVRFLSTHPQRLAEMSANAGALGRRTAAQSVCERMFASAKRGRL